MNQSAILLITSKQPNNKHHGTGFIIKSDHDSAYILTCAHVIDDIGGKTEISVNGLRGELLISGKAIGIDLAIIKVSPFEVMLPYRMAQTKPLSKISIRGFVSVGNHYLLNTLHGVVKQSIHLSSTIGNERMEAWEVTINEGGLEPGYSGAPVLDDVGNIVAIMSHRWTAGDKGIAINISAVFSLEHPITNNLVADIIGDHKPREDWGDAAAPKAFYGRNETLNRLKEWIISDRCRLIAILGIGGIGKSALAAELVERVKDQFDYIIWRDLRNGLPIDLFLEDCIKFITDQAVPGVPELLTHKIGLLIRLLSLKRCLIILDNAESILEHGRTPGQYRIGFELYGEFIRRAGEVAHSSCIIITSREKPREINLLENSLGPTRSETLDGLAETAARSLLAQWALDGNQDTWSRLVIHYGGNPLALKIVASTIKKWFGGNIMHFLNEEISLFGDIEELIGAQLKTLTATEKDVMYWIALCRETLSLPKLLKDIAYWLVVLQEPIDTNYLEAQILRPISRVELLEALDSLHSKSLIEKIDDRFSLQPVVMEYLTESFIESLFLEFAREKLFLLRSHAIIQANTKDYILVSQKHFILAPLVRKMRVAFGQSEIARKIARILERIREEKRYSTGYAAGNLLNMLVEMQEDLSVYDFSNVNIWQAHLANSSLRNVNFENSDLSMSVFASTFDGMLCVAYSPSGNQIVAGAINGEAVVWDTDRNRQIHRLRGHTGWIRAATFNHDGRIIATGCGDKTIRLWDASTSNCIKILKGHKDWVRTVVFRPYSTNLVSAGSDGKIIEWDISTGEPIKIIDGHDDWIWSIAVFQDGARLVSAGNDRNAIVWDLDHGKEIIRIRQHPQPIRTVDVSSKLELIATGCNDHIVRIWSAKTGKWIRDLVGHTNGIWSVAFSDDGRILATGSIDKTVKLWDSISGELLRTLHAHVGRVYSVAFHPNGESLVSASEDQTIRIWNISNGWCLRAIVGHTSRVHDIAFNPSTESLLSGGSDHVLRIWGIGKNSEPMELMGHTGIIKSVAWGSDGRVASCGNDQTIRIWDIPREAVERTLTGHTSWVTTIEFSRSGEYLVSGSDDRTIRIWEVETGNTVGILEGHSSWVSSAVFSSDGKYVFSGSADMTVRKWQARIGTNSVLFRHDLRVNSVCVDSSDKLICSASDDGMIILWSIDNNEFLGYLAGHDSPVLCVAFSPDSLLLASGGLDGTVRIWDVATRTCSMVLSGHRAGVLSVRFDNKGTILASGSDDETIRLWDIKKGLEQKVLKSRKLYDGLNISGTTGLIEVEKRGLIALGAFDSSGHPKIENR